MTGHNIRRELRRETLEVSRQFFALPIEQKNEIHISEHADCIGYQKFGENVTQHKRDQHEGIDYYRNTSDPSHAPFNIGATPWPREPQHFESVFAEYRTVL